MHLLAALYGVVVYEPDLWREPHVDGFCEMLPDIPVCQAFQGDSINQFIQPVSAGKHVT